MKLRNNVAVVALGTALWSAPASAIDFNNVFGDNIFNDTAGVFTEMLDTFMPGVTNIRLGFGPAVGPEFEGGDHYKTGGAALISLRYRDILEIDNNNLRINVFGREGWLRSENFSAGPLVKLDFGRDEKDALELTGLGDVGTSLELGVFAAYTMGPARYRVKLRQDVAGGHSGFLIDGDITLAVYRSEDMSVAARISSTWASSDYMNAYFGVTAAQSAASGLAVFAASSGIKDVTLSTGGEYRFTDRWSLALNASFSRLMSDAKKNPLVSTRGSATQYGVGVFAIYTF
ncbi:MAG: MipA/OmpV family protein [Rhodobacteraceae bacterium]|nr:MipA/OmpV family protein [Paracoccaceae bacterium]